MDFGSIASLFNPAAAAAKIGGSLGGSLGFGEGHGVYQPAVYDNRGATRLNEYASDPSKQWADTSAANPALASLFSDGGAFNDAAAQSKDLLAHGMDLNSNDYKAYGQASDEIARQSGQTENNLSNSLSSRGFGAGPSGSAGALFSGVQGNKNEALAKAQTGIADARMNFAQKALTDTRNFMNSAAGTANTAISNNSSNLAKGADAYNTGWKTADDSYYKSFTNNQENTNPSFGEMAGANLSQLMNPVAGARAGASLIGASGGLGGKPGATPKSSEVV